MLILSGMALHALKYRVVFVLFHFKTTNSFAWLKDYEWCGITEKLEESQLLNRVESEGVTFFSHQIFYVVHQSQICFLRLSFKL